jgi:DNA-binding NarL/FixJ family response regulator/class 3 adenylate cyclase
MMFVRMEEGFVTVLFTDLVGSSALFASVGDDRADAIRRRHFDALRKAVEDHGGREIKSTGDGLMIAFGSAVAAVRCAVAMQRATSAAPDRLRIRIGLDAGEPVPDGDDLYGTPVIVASRLCESAAGEEILASEIVRKIAGPRLADLMEPSGALRLAGIPERVSVARVRWEEGTEPAEPTAAPKQIDVVVADDQSLLRTGFRVILDAEPDIRVVGEASDGRFALDLVRRTRPDVVLMDIRMPELDGLKAGEAILADPDLDTAVLMLTTFDLDEYIYEALRIGASGFLLKDTPADRLLDAVRVAASGDALLAPSITRRLIERFAHTIRPEPGAVPTALAELTPREIEVLTLVARGLSNSEIASELVVGENTVKTHVAHVLGKLGLRDRVQAVVLAYECGLVTPDPLPADSESG